MERQEAIQGVRIVLTSYTASFRVPLFHELISKFSRRWGSRRGGRRPGRWQAASRAEPSTFGTLLSAIRRTAPRCFEPSDRPSDAGTPAFPLGFPSPAADSSECPPESPAAATPPESLAPHRPHPHIPPSAASAPAPSRSSSPAGPPAPPPTDGRRAHSQAHHHTQGKPIFIHPNARFGPFSLLMPIYSYPFPPFFASTCTFPGVSPQPRRACRILCQIPFS
jgi:hypothetical protein